MAKSITTGPGAEGLCSADLLTTMSIWSEPKKIIRALAGAAALRQVQLAKKKVSYPAVIFELRRTVLQGFSCQMSGCRSFR
jgi:hypothetical protein